MWTVEGEKKIINKWIFNVHISILRGFAIKILKKFPSLSLSLSLLTIENVHWLKLVFVRGLDFNNPLDSQWTCVKIVWINSWTIFVCLSNYFTGWYFIKHILESTEFSPQQGCSLNSDWAEWHLIFHLKGDQRPVKAGGKGKGFSALEGYRARRNLVTFFFHFFLSHCNTFRGAERRK